MSEASLRTVLPFSEGRLLFCVTSQEIQEGGRKNVALVPKIPKRE